MGGALFRSFATRAEATAWLSAAGGDGAGAPVGAPSSSSAAAGAGAGASPAGGGAGLLQPGPDFKVNASVAANARR